MLRIVLDDDISLLSFHIQQKITRLKGCCLMVIFLRDSELRSVIAIWDIRRRESLFDSLDPSLPSSGQYQFQLIYERDKDWRPFFPLTGLFISDRASCSSMKIPIHHYYLTKDTIREECRSGPRILFLKSDPEMQVRVLDFIKREMTAKHSFIPQLEQWLEIANHYACWYIIDNKDEIVSVIVGEVMGSGFRVCYLSSLSFITYHLRILMNFNYERIQLPITANVNPKLLKQKLGEPYFTSYSYIEWNFDDNDIAMLLL